VIEKDIEDTPRTLEVICEREDFHTELNGNCYCSLAIAKKIYCRWQASEQDHNGLYPCIKWAIKKAELN
jgi:hypothetical protein